MLPFKCDFGYMRNNFALTSGTEVKAKVRARGARSQQWYSDQRANCLRKRARTQMLWNLLLAGDWHASFETAAQCVQPHLMRT